MLVPSWVSKMLNKNRKTKGLLPIGVTFVPRISKYMAKCSTDGVQKTLGYYDTPEEAFSVYKKYREAYVERMARENKATLSPEVYEMMMNWEVKYND